MAEIHKFFPSREVVDDPLAWDAEAQDGPSPPERSGRRRGAGGLSRQDFACAAALAMGAAGASQIRLRMSKSSPHVVRTRGGICAPMQQALQRMSLA